jgi:hypothetical protein
MHCAACGARLPDDARFCPGCGQALRLSRPAAAASVGGGGRERRGGVQRDEVEAVGAARQELGERMEAEVIDAFLDRVEGSLEARIDAQVERRLAGFRGLRRGQRAVTGRIIASAGLATGATAIIGGSAGAEGAAAVAAVWASVAAMNLVYAIADQRRE